MKRILIIGAVLLAMGLGACTDDFLSQKNPNEPSVDQFWKTRDDALAAVYSMYAPLTYQYRYGFFEYGWGPENWRGDDVIYASTYAAFSKIARFTNTPDIWEVAELYRNNYDIVNAANQCVGNIGKCEIPDAEVKQLVAEAKFMRGYAYFRLLRNFRYIPLYKESPKSKDDIYVPQAERSVVWAFIEEDLKEAIELLPLTREGDEVGRATKAAAAGFLAYAYVYQQKYADAETLLNRIIGGEFGAFDLLSVDNYNQNWDGTNEHNVESLFEIHMADVSPKGKTTNILQAEFLAWQEANAAPWLFNEVQKVKDVDGNVDQRYYKSMISPDLPFTAPLGVYTDLSDFVSGRVLILKHTTPSWDPWERWENNFVLMRFADILLLQAEAINEQGRADDARPFINRVRTRARIAELPTGLTKTQMREHIMHERAIELCFEGRRWYDLVRWHEAGWFDIKTLLTEHGKPGAENFSNQYLYYPIPEYEYETNPKLDRNKQW